MARHTHITHIRKCPYCGKEYFRYDDYFHSRANITQLEKIYGSPYVQCEYCKKMFRDTEKREIALTGVESKDTMLISGGGIVGIIFSLLIFYGASISGGSNDVAVLWLLGIVFAVPAVLDLINYPKRKAIIQKLTQESSDRLRQPKYAAELKKLGYKVPDSFLYSSPEDHAGTSHTSGFASSHTTTESVHTSAPSDGVMWTAPSFIQNPSCNENISAGHTSSPKPEKMRSCPCCGQLVHYGPGKCPYCDAVLNN